MGKIKPKGFIKVIFFLLVLSLLTTSTGCWNRRELDTLAIIVALGIDKSKENGEYILTSQIIKPGEIKAAGEKEKKGSGSGAVWTVISRGKTIFDAARNATAQSDRKLFFPHLKVIVIREEAAKAGVGSLVDLLDRDHEPRLLSWVFVAKGEAKEIIKAEHEQEKIPASALGRLVKAGGATSMAATINLLEFLKRISSKTTAPFISRIELETDPSFNLERTNKIIKDIEALLKKEPEVLNFSAQVGYEPGGHFLGKTGALGVNQGYFTVELSSRKERQETIWQIEDRIREKIKKIPGIKSFIVKEAGSTAVATTVAPIDLRISGPDKEVLNYLAGVIEEKINQVPGTVNIYRSWHI